MIEITSSYRKVLPSIKTMKNNEVKSKHSEGEWFRRTGEWLFSVAEHGEWRFRKPHTPMQRWHFPEAMRWCYGKDDTYA